MSRHFHDSVTLTLFVRRPKEDIQVPGEDFFEIEHHANPVAFPRGRVSIVWNLVTLGLEGPERPEPYRFHEDGVQFDPPPESKLRVVEGGRGRVSDTQWAIVVQNDRVTQDGSCPVDYSFRLLGANGKVYGPPIDPTILVTPDPTIPPG